jgi:hypothetical protein
LPPSKRFCFMSLAWNVACSFVLYFFLTLVS